MVWQTAPIKRNSAGKNAGKKHGMHAGWQANTHPWQQWGRWIWKPLWWGLGCRCLYDSTRQEHAVGSRLHNNGTCCQLRITQRCESLVTLSPADIDLTLALSHTALIARPHSGTHTPSTRRKDWHGRTSATIHHCFELGDRLVSLKPRA